MDANTVIAGCAVVIAVGSLVVSVYEARATRTHDRHSVQPLLVFRTGFPAAGTAGLILANYGLGPAKIIKTTLMLDGAKLGDLSKESVDKLRGDDPDRPHATTLGGQAFLDTDYKEFLLRVDSYNPSLAQHSEFRDLIEHRLAIEIEYSSLYDERFTARYPPPIEEPGN